MRDVGTPLRKGYYNALDGNLTIGATNIPVYDGKVEGSISHDVYVLIQDSSTVSKNSMDHFAYETTITIDIKQRLKAVVSHEQIETISDQIHQIVKPTPRTLGVTIDSPFKLIIIAVDNNNTDRPAEVNTGEFMVSKSLRFRNHII